MHNLNYPLNFVFKIFTPSNDFSVTDSSGNEIAYTRQKMFRLKEAVQVFRDHRRREVLYTLKADRIIDFNAAYILRDANGQMLGQLKRAGMRSLWRTHYTLVDAAGTPVFTIQEANPWVALADGVVSEIPVIGLLSGYVLNPSYIIADMQGREIFLLRKVPSLMERRFHLEKRANVSAQQETLVVLGLMMLMLQERGDG